MYMQALCTTLLSAERKFGLGDAVALRIDAALQVLEITNETEVCVYSVCACVYVHVCMCAYVCEYVCMCAYVCEHVYVFVDEDVSACVVSLFSREP